MRKIITASLWVVALVLAAGFHFPLKALGALGAIMTALTLPDVSNSLIDVVAAHPSLTTDALPLLLVAAVLASMALTFVWPHAVADLLHKPRIKCTFDPNLRACFLQTTATSYIAVVGPGITSSVDYTLASSPAYTSSDISKGFQDGPFRSEERKYARIQVESGGQYDVENCSASLVSINLSGDTFVYNDGPIALTIAPAERQNAEFKNISPGRPEYIDVFYVTDKNRIGIGSKQIPASTNFNAAFAADGAYVFTAIVSAKGCSSRKVKIGLQWDQDWQTATVWCPS